VAASPSLKDLAVPVGIEPMEAKLVAELPREDGWQFEPKWDGFRCLAYRAGSEVDLRAKSGKPLTRYFPEVAAMLRSLPQKEFVLDGELAIPLGDTLSFDALQMRIHPAASRIKKLSAETPAILILFDMLLDAKGESLIEAALVSRRAVLEAFYDKARERTGLKLSPYTRDRDMAERWLKEARGALDGVVAKPLDGAYIPASAPCSRSSRSGPPIAWSAGSATPRAPGSSARSCSASTTRTASSITSASPRPSPTRSARRLRGNSRR
jgi:ATP-dependent DNA ligase